MLLKELMNVEEVRSFKCSLKMILSNILNEVLHLKYSWKQYDSKNYNCFNLFSKTVLALSTSDKSCLNSCSDSACKKLQNDAPLRS